MRSSVDLPQPDGPTMQRNSPALTSRLMVSSATTRPWLLTYSLHTPAMLIAAPRRWTMPILPASRGGTLAHIPEKWAPVFRKGYAPLKSAYPGKVGTGFHGPLSGGRALRARRASVNG